MWILKNNGKILEDINLEPDTVEEEVLINGAIILESYCKSVPLIRGLGMNSSRLHRPTNVIANEVVADIHDQFEQFEPRAILGKSRSPRTTQPGIWILR